MALTAQEIRFSSVEVVEILTSKPYLEGDQHLQIVAHQLKEFLTRNYSSLTPPLLQW